MCVCVCVCVYIYIYYIYTIQKEERRKSKEKKELEEMVWEVYRELDRVAEKKMELLNNIDLIKDELHKFPSIFLPKLQSFVRPDESFTALSSSIDGVMYAVDGRSELNYIYL